MNRVVVVGAWGAGKSRFAATLAAALAVPLIEHDPLYWAADWGPRPVAEFRALVADATAGEAWVADGNFSAARDIVWGRADTLVWLDLPLPLVMWRLAQRQLRRFVTREALWHGNRERFGDVLGRESLLWKLPARHAGWRREYPTLLQAPEYAHLRMHRLRSAAAADRWLRAAASEPNVAPEGRTSSTSWRHPARRAP
jgi:hypothetical protein